MADDDGPNNLIHFPRVGYTEPTEPPPETPDPAPADVPFAAPADVSEDAPEGFAPATRPSPLDTLTALADPGLGSPFTADSEPDAAPASPGAMVPATFRSEAAQPVAPRLGALSLAAILAVSVAAMRGIHTAISGRRESREQREAVAKTASTAKDSPSGGGSKKQLQPSHDWGRKTLQRGPGGPSGRSGSGPGRSGRGGSGPYSGSGGGRRNAPTTKSPSSSGGGRGGRGGGSGSGGGKGGSGITSPRRTSQGGGLNLKKNNRGPGSSGSGGPGGSGGSKGPGSGGGGKKRSPGGSGSGSSGGGSSTNRKRGPGSTGSGGSAGTSGGRKRGPGASGSGTGTKSPGKGSGTGAGTGAPGSKGTGTGKGTGPKSGTKKSPRGTTGPSGILRKKPGTTTSGTGPKTKSKGAGKTGSGPTPTGKGGGKKGKTKSGKRGGSGPVGPVHKAPGGKSRKGKKVTLTPGIAHGTFAAVDKYGCRCGKCRRFKREYNRKVIGAMKSAARGRTTLGEAIHETAEKRLRRRRKRIKPVMTKVKVKKPKKKTGPKTKTGSTKPAGPTAPAGPAPKAPAKGGSWNTAKARARKRARMRTRPVTVSGPTPAPAGGTSPKPTAPTGPTPKPVTATAAVAGGTTALPPGPATGAGTVTGTGEPRLSPFEALGMATAVSAPAGPITVERADSPRPDPAKPSAGLPAGTSTKENSVSDAWLAKYGDAAVAEMSSEHQTEVTLDDTLDVLEELTQQSFKAHETCKKLAAKARQIRYDLDELAADLRSRHNVTGRLTGAAMAKLAESMEVLARKADEMSTKSLAAAELSETVENAMFDAYRPVQQATEDAGLLVPSARVHNEG
ncbi:hypothetical protein [Streptomyces sp. NPDC007905]|uniref:hypothetical protein n=1 Tax=Streptomyces sp. NPDC007905 TaxID=3364788 RepID=UPI0036E944E6